MKISITDQTKGPFKRSTEWEGNVREYWCQEAVVDVNEIERQLWEIPIADQNSAYPVGEYQLALSSFATKKFPNVKGQVSDYGVSRPDFKSLKLIPVSGKAK
jgi:hypothetical protein